MNTFMPHLKQTAKALDEVTVCFTGAGPSVLFGIPVPGGSRACPSLRDSCASGDLNPRGLFEHFHRTSRNETRSQESRLNFRTRW